VIGPGLSIGDERIAGAPRLACNLGAKEPLHEAAGLVGQCFELISEAAAGLLPSLWGEQQPQRESRSPSSKSTQNSSASGTATD